ncbi:pentapeptide repeat-containing protein [Helicobacter didelphidarum]|nr:pentapeptide repeat-containing protein [Helicobacter didelphidarum]
MLDDDSIYRIRSNIAKFLFGDKNQIEKIKHRHNIISITDEEAQEIALNKETTQIVEKKEDIFSIQNEDDIGSQSKEEVLNFMSPLIDKVNLEFVSCSFSKAIINQTKDKISASETNNYHFDAEEQPEYSQKKYMKYSGSLIFQDCMFEKEVNFSNTYFAQKFTLLGKIEFKEKANFTNTFFNSFNSSQVNLIFNSDCLFKNSWFLDSFNDDNIIYKKHNILFNKTKFNGIADFSNTYFSNGECATTYEEEKYIEFQECEFKEINFSNCQFRSNISFGGVFKGNQKINFSQCQFEKKFDFINRIINDEKKSLEIDFSRANFNEDIDFSGSKNIQYIFKENGFSKDLNFKDSEFNSPLDYSKSTFSGNIDFKRCEFKAKVIFKNATFKQEVDFSNAIFKGKANFSNTKFLHDTYFHRAIFKKDLQMYRSHFTKVANFYFVTFQNVPNFSACVFEKPKQVNFVGVDTSKLTLEVNKHYIENIANEDKKTDDKRTIKEWKIQHAQNTKDSYRVIKDMLLTQNNLLEAQAWHKLELYAKELELEFKTERENNENTTLSIINKIKKYLSYIIKVIKKITKKDKIDKYQLWFYRTTSDHHTDLLKSFHSLLILIGMFGILSAIAIYGVNYCAFSFWDLHPHSASEFYSKHINHFVLTNSIKTLIINLTLNIVFIGLFLFVLSFNDKMILRYFSIILSYIITFSILLSSPKYLVPVIGVFTDKGMLLDPLSVIGAVYTIFFGFMVFSLIKTARKNSIIPS